MSVLIDPYMFELSEEQEIKNNIDFFRKIIQISSRPDSKIILYAGMIERLQQRTVQPFPIQLDLIQDRDLKKTIAILNNSFSNALLSSIEGIDIDACDGEQNFSVEDDCSINEDDKYYEMAIILLIPCYSVDRVIEDKILTGEKKVGKQIGDGFTLKCACLKKNYVKKCVFSSVEDFLPEKEKVLERIKELKKSQGITISATVPAEMGSHHNHVQKNMFSELNNLSFKNKRVLKLLKEFGLTKIIFGAFTPKGVKASGTIDISYVEEKETQDIIKAKFYAETNMQIETDLYFPKGVGKLLQKYFMDDTLEYTNVRDLLEKVN